MTRHPRQSRRRTEGILVFADWTEDIPDAPGPPSVLKAPIASPARAFHL